MTRHYVLILIIPLGVQSVECELEGVVRMWPRAMLACGRQRRGWWRRRLQWKCVYETLSSNLKRHIPSLCHCSDVWIYIFLCGIARVASNCLIYSYRNKISTNEWKQISDYFTLYYNLRLNRFMEVNFKRVFKENNQIFMKN